MSLRGAPPLFSRGPPWVHCCTQNCASRGYLGHMDSWCVGFVYSGPLCCRRGAPLRWPHTARGGLRHPPERVQRQGRRHLHNWAQVPCNGAPIHVPELKTGCELSSFLCTGLPQGVSCVVPKHGDVVLTSCPLRGEKGCRGGCTCGGARAPKGA